jgi:ribose transport system permease protein
MRRYMPFAILGLMVALFFGLSSLYGRDVSVFNAYNGMQTFAGVGVVALAVGITMIAGELNLSALGTYGLGAIVAVKTGANEPMLGLAVAVLVGVTAGGVQGWLAGRTGLSSVPISLGGYLVLLGLMHVLTNSESLPYQNLDVGAFLDGRILEIFSVRSLTVLAMFVAVGLCLGYTSWGRDVRAVGSDRRAARVAGVRVTRTVTSVFAVSGGVSAFGGALLGYSIATATPGIGLAPLITGIAAALLGGVLLSGGIGTVSGIAAGMLTLSLLQETLAIIAAPAYLASLVTGALLSVVIVVDAPFLSAWWRGVFWTSRTTAHR